MKHTPLVAAVATVATMSLSWPLAPPAAAHDTSYATSSSFGLTSSGGEAALGTVSSPQADCVSNRKVKLFQARPGRDRLVGVDRRTGVPSGSGEGYWVIPTDLRDGRRYYAVVVRKDVGSGSHDHVCRAHRSIAQEWPA